ncbi:membrane protein insertase YidC [Candidatus Berkelbacteria bacterium]|nr:membrane protein insertase YidC [Candidatus Berkelbacteria bacterium]
MTAIKDLFTTLFYQPLYNLLFYFVYLLPGESFGLGVIALTLLVRLILVPSSAQAVRSQRELAVLQPKIDALRAELKDKPEELNRKMLALYQEHNVNPFGACLPLLIQLPVLLILYRVFVNGIHPGNFSLLYPFVPAPAALSTQFLGIDLAAPSLLLGVIAGALQFVQTWQLMRKRPASGAKKDPAAAAAEQMSRRMMYVMPLITVFAASTLPSALALYWVVTTLFGIVQQWWILRTHPEVATPHIAVQIRQKGQTETTTEVPNTATIALPAPRKRNRTVQARRKKGTRRR